MSQAKLKKLGFHTCIEMSVGDSLLRLQVTQYATMTLIPCLLGIKLLQAQTQLLPVILAVLSFFFMSLFCRRVLKEERVAIKEGKASYVLKLHGLEAIFPGIMILCFSLPFIFLALLFSFCGVILALGDTLEKLLSGQIGRHTRSSR
jgi:hypothetical protein